MTSTCMSPSPTRRVAATAAHPDGDRVHLPHFRLVELDLRRDIDCLPIDDEPAYPFLPQLGEDEIELLTVDLERRRAQLHLGAFGQRKDRLDDLHGRATRRDFAAAWAVRLADRRVE